MEPPSPALVDLLAELRLASPRDWRLAARPCRRLAYDLPTFDNVWIDALLRLRRLTPFQASELRDGQGERLRVGDFVLLDRLGGNGTDSSTNLAKSIGGGSAVALKILKPSPARIPSLAKQLCEVIETSRQLRASSVIAPHDLIVEADRIILVSHFAAGRDARSQLMRGGALPAGSVIEIARQLFAGLGEAHRLGLVHGDIRLEAIRVSKQRNASLVDLGIRSCIAPMLSIHSERSPEWYEGTAPERIGTSAPATAATDVYALGSALWHLHAGRPPFPRGDRLAVLAAHRSKPLPCVRNYAADVPKEFAEVLQEMTAADPAARPKNLAELERRCHVKSHRRTDRARTHGRKNETAFPWVSAAAVLFALSGAALYFADRDAVATVLEMRVGQSTSSDGAISSNETKLSRSFSAIPPPDSHGVVNLAHAGPFAAADIAVRGPLVLRGTPARPAVILVDDQPLHLWADDVTLEHVILVTSEGEAIAAPSALALIEAQNLTIRSCRFESSHGLYSLRTARPAAVAWRPIDRADPTGGHITLSDCVARRVQDVVFFAEAPRRVRISNVLSVRTQSLLAFRSPGRAPVDVELSKVTARDAGTVIKAGSQDGEIQIDVNGTDSVLELKNGALFSKVGATQCAFTWRGSGVVTTSEVKMTADSTAVKEASTAGALQQRTEAEGVAAGQVTFAGSASGPDSACAARVTGVPRRADRPPGIDLSRLPPARAAHAAD
ncbi:MAG: protein kinase [Planctomycetota bacterium]|nr:protein kinase [Planctomycetaceae bacterium]MDQ3331790.1 protein kinase [Planctomycetota bacterium]